MSKKNPLTPEEIQAIADAVAKQIAPKTIPYPVPTYYGPYVYPPVRQTYWWSSHSSPGGIQG